MPSDSNIRDEKLIFTQYQTRSLTARSPPCRNPPLLLPNILPEKRRPISRRKFSPLLLFLHLLHPSRREPRVRCRPSQHHHRRPCVPSSMQRRQRQSCRMSVSVVRRRCRPLAVPGLVFHRPLLLLRAAGESFRLPASPLLPLPLRGTLVTTLKPLSSWPPASPWSPQPSKMLPLPRLLA